MKRSWAKDGQLFGAWMTIPDAFAAELLAAQGFHYVCVDMQHGLIGYDRMVEMVRAISSRGAAPFVRVLANEHGEIMRALDAGARGIVVPLVNTPEEAAHAAEACRFPPRGIRSFGPTRARLTQGGSIAELESVACFVQVETTIAFERVDAIASTPGVDGIYVGPSDLALSFGESPQQPECHEVMRGRIDAIQAATRLADIDIGIHCLNGSRAADYARRGFDFVTVIVDSNHLSTTAQTEFRAATASSLAHCVKRA